MQNISINFQVPQGWHELGDKQLRYVYQLLAGDCSCKREQRSNLFESMPSAAELGHSHFSADEIKTLCLLQWSDTKVIGKQPTGAYLLRKGKTMFEVTPLTLAEILPTFDWLCDIPSQPVRISKINRCPALTADFSEVPFDTFIICDNLYQVISLRKMMHFSTNSARRSTAKIVKRRKNRWFSRKYLASRLNIQEFYADSLGQEFCRAISNALSPSFGRFA